MKIVRPTFLLDETKCKKNIQRIVEKARMNNLVFRPHFKTHQSATIGKWFREQGVSKITVSSFTMAEYFLRTGWNDILVAFPVNLLEISQIIKLASRINLSLTLESLDSVKFLQDKLKYPVMVYLKIDTGYHRTGIAWDDFNEIQRIIQAIHVANNLNFTGFLVHSGHTYQQRTRSEILKIHEDSIQKLADLKKTFTSDYFQPVISIGDTPSCSIADNFEGVDEIRPGNFVFYDVMQCEIGSCRPEDIAVAMACPVVAKHPGRNEIVIYGGAVHLSKESIMDATGRILYGKIVNIHPDGWGLPVENAFVKSLSQEHGIIYITKEHFDTIKIGDVLGILPVHSCLTASQMKSYLTLDGRHMSKMH